MQNALDWVLSYMEDLACPRSVALAILVRHSEWEQIISLDCSPINYCSPDAYLRAVSATDLLRKCRSLPPQGDLKKVTLDKWHWAEAECFKTNRRLWDLYNDCALPHAHVVRLHDYFDRVRKIVLEIIGPSPGVFDGRFGPGATMSDPSHRCVLPHKMASTPSFTPEALGYLVPWIGTSWARACAHREDIPLSVRGNAYFTVPKTAKTLRACAKEPSINGYFQLGLGRLLRERLKAHAIDLEQGQTIHRRVACAASFTGEFATIDLSSASDCVSKELVKLLLPPRWFSALDDLRSHFTRVNGSWIWLEKFSSMGNGFTFELETLIFLSLILALDPKGLVPGWNVWVYGDDIIVPTSHADDVVAALRYCGFTPNVKKTFVDGPFRESCGGDYYMGMSVRAHYIEEFPDEPQKWITLINGVNRVASQLRDLRHGVSRPFRSWFRAMDNLPSSVRGCRGPIALGDLVIHDAEDRWTTRTRHSIRWIRVYRPAKWRRLSLNRFDPTIKLATALYLIGSSVGTSLHQEDVMRIERRKASRETDIIPRNATLGYKVGWTPFS